MKLLLQILSIALSTIALFSAYAHAATQRDVCSWKNPAATIAIDSFCRGQNNLVVPTNYAGKGKASGQHWLYPMKVSIKGNCSPAQWVPENYCWTQFYDICIKGGPRGKGSARYGRNGCQTWSIERDGW